MATHYDRNVLDAALQALERELRRALPASPYEFVVIGGASLLLRGIGSRATSDVDVLGVRASSKVVPASPLPAVVRDAAALVARQVGLDEGWFGDDRTLGVLKAPPPAGYEARLERHEVGPALVLWFPNRADLTGLKLDAASNSGELPGESKHHDDLVVLAPTDTELANGLHWMASLYAPGDPALDDAKRTIEWLRERR